MSVDDALVGSRLQKPTHGSLDVLRRILYRPMPDVLQPHDFRPRPNRGKAIHIRVTPMSAAGAQTAGAAVANGGVLLI